MVAQSVTAEDMAYIALAQDHAEQNQPPSLNGLVTLLANDMAQVQDALWVKRNARLIESFCGGGRWVACLTP